jgi:L-Ala-D/L-Glu epimerase
MRLACAPQIARLSGMIAVTPDIFRLAEAFTIARGSRTEARVLTVRITRDGAAGWGECVPMPTTAKALKP